MTQPHNGSAKYYDFVMERRFGTSFVNLTANNISKIRDLTENGKILDFGAGTGRISIPLANAGYEVTAVDCSSNMLEELKSKAAAQNLNIPTHMRLTELITKDFDLAIAIFTVLAYINTEAELEEVFQSIYNSLKPGGLFMFDLENKASYDQICRYNNGVIHEKTYDRVTISFQDNDPNLCNYHEQASGTLPNGEDFNYSESFTIKFWTVDEVCSILSSVGFTQTDKFSYAGANYFILKRNQD